MADEITMTRQPGAADTLARQAEAARTLARQPVRLIYATNPRFGEAVVVPGYVLWLLSADNVTGTGDQVDTWGTKSDSGVTLTEAGSGKPLVLGSRVDMDNETSQANHFTCGDTSTFQAMTETGEFLFAWRGTVDVSDNAAFAVNSTILHTRGSSGRGAAVYTYSSGANLAFVLWNGSGTVTTLCDWSGWGAYYTDGAIVDIAVEGDGANVDIVVDGVVRDTDTHTADSGVHANTPLVGKLVNSSSGGYLIGSIIGMFYDDNNDKTVSEATALVTPTRTFEASDYGTPIAEYSARWGYEDGSSVTRLVDESGNSNIFNAPAGSNEGVASDSGPHITLDGDDYYTVADKAPFNGLHQTPQGTIVVRVALASASTSAINALFSTSLFLSSNIGVFLCIDDRSTRDNRIRFAVFNSATAVYVTNEADADITGLSDGEWITVAVAWDATDARFYLDGTLIDTVASSGETPSASDSSKVGTIAGAGDSPTYAPSANLSDVMVFSDKLSAANVSALTTALEAEYA